MLGVLHLLRSVFPPRRALWTAYNTGTEPDHASEAIGGKMGLGGRLTGLSESPMNLGAVIASNPAAPKVG